jgi:predicted secreted protein
MGCTGGSTGRGMQSRAIVMHRAIGSGRRSPVSRAASRNGARARRLAVLSAVLACLLRTGVAWASGPAPVGVATVPPGGPSATAAAVSAGAPTLSLDAQARSTVPRDEMVLTLAVEREGPEAGPLNEAVLSQLNRTLAEARAVEGVSGRLGSVWTMPVHAPGATRPSGWRVRGEVVLESARMQTLAQLGGRLGERMLLTGVHFRLSAARRQAEERRLLGEAARAFRERAAEAASAFGYPRYALQALSLHSGGEAGPRPVPVPARARAGVAAAAEPLPTDAGDAEVVVGVSGTILLER